jgi:hypothetical protein
VRMNVNTGHLIMNIFNEMRTLLQSPENKWVGRALFDMNAAFPGGPSTRPTCGSLGTRILGRMLDLEGHFLT